MKNEYTGKKRGPKSKTRTELLDGLQQIAQMHNRGYSQTEIAIKMGLTQAAISIKLKQIRQKYVQQQEEWTHDMIAEKLEQYREVRKEAWEAWERSKLDSKKRVKEVSPSKPKQLDDGTVEEQEARVKLILTKEGRLPSAQYLQIVLDTFKAERDLLGLDEAKKVEVNASVFSWDTLLQGIQEAVPDTVEQQILEVENRVIEDQSNKEQSNGKEETGSREQAEG